MKHWSSERLLKLMAIMYTLLFVFLAFTNPQNLSIPLLIAPIIWLFACLVLSFYVVFRRFSHSKQIAHRKIMAYAVTASSLICLILLLKSINQLSSRDILLVCIFLVVLSIYFPKIKFNKKDDKIV